MQNFVNKKNKLLNDQGNLTLPGYSTSLVFNYNRNDIKVSKLKIKEWDYYYIGNSQFGVALTIADNGYMGLISASLLDFKSKWQNTTSIMTILPMGKTNLPKTSEIGDVSFKNKRVSIAFKNNGIERHLHCKMKKFYQDKELNVNIILKDFPQESMVIATPFDKPKHFYYNQKINCMKAEGIAKIGDKTYSFNTDDSYGTLDWGRGVWTYKNTWYWGSLSTNINGEPFGFNIGYGFGDTSSATENMIFYKGKAHKLNNIVFNIPKKQGKDDFLSPWTFTADDNRLNMTFEPILNRKAITNLGLLCSKQNQVFGYFSGKAILDDNTEITIDKKLGFAEKVFNKW
ncbi:DUF2804 domain-containing protein [Mycoplasmatota bacterium]|nr:DUF2804 domain-containing protein [Mycoplasmatota bacterium]